MDSLDKRKERLLEKYWDGETTLDEERELRKLLTEDDGALHEFFTSTDEIKEMTVDINVTELVGEHKAGAARRIHLRSFLAYAASVILLIGAFVGYNQMNTHSSPALSMEETYEDPEAALEQTKAALAFVMNKMNKGQEETIQNVKRIKVLDDVIPK